MVSGIKVSHVVSMGYGARRWLSKMALVLAMLPGAALAQETTIAAFGASLVAGYGLPMEDGFVPQLEAWLNARGHAVRVLNAGVSGDTSAGGLARIDWTLTPDVDALIVTLGGNDLLRGLPPSTTRENLSGILDAAGTADVPVLLAGFDAPLNFGPDFQRDFNAIYPELAEEYDALHHENFVGAVTDALAQGASRRDLLQEDLLHPTAAGVALMVEAIGPEVEALLGRVD